MKQENSESLLKLIVGDDLTLAYSGRFNDSMTDRIIELSEAYLESHEQLSKLRRKASFLVAESFQNVIRHGTKDTDTPMFSAGNESFMIRFIKNRCFISSENAIPTEHVPELKAKMDQVNQYNTEELKVIYKQILEGGELSEKGGAGLGLIEMARKTGNRLHYIFKSINEKYSVFYFMLVLEHGEIDENIAEFESVLEEMIKFIQESRRANQFLFFKGEFEQDLILPMLQMIEKNMESQLDPHSVKFKFYHAAVELMQNIGHHSKPVNGKHTGMVSVGKGEDGYFVKGTNPIDKNSADNLELMLSDLKTKDSESLDLVYRQKLKTSMKSDEKSAGLGFIDLARISRSWEYEFEKTEQSDLYFHFKVVI